MELWQAAPHLGYLRIPAIGRMMSRRSDEAPELRSAEYSVQQLDRCETLADRRTMN